jgi:hypothetical protein
MQVVWKDFWDDLFDVLSQWTTFSSPAKALKWETYPYQPTSKPVLWNMGLLLHGSLAIYILLLALTRLSPWLRITLLIISAWDVFVNNPGDWPLSLCLAGIVLADSRHVRAKLQHKRRQLRLVLKATSHLVLVLGLFFGRWPDIGAENGLWYRHFATWPDLGHERYSHTYF